MRTLFSIIAISFFSGNFFAQDLVNVNGDFLTENNTKASGAYMSYHENGNIKAEYSFLDGKEHGITTFYFPNGKIKEQGSFDYGVKIGKWTSWSEKGSVAGVVNFNQKGERDGTWEIWDDNGTQRALMNYTEGKRTGVWKVWDEDGNLINEKTYE